MLNKQQKEAVNLPLAHSLVIAGAGTGKTKTLISRIEHTLKTLEPEEIVAITFTNKAATEMKNRLGREDVIVGTFHSFALSLLKEDLENFGFSKIKLMDEREQKLFIKDLFHDNNWNDKNNAVDRLMEYVNSQKEQGNRSDQVVYRGIGIKKLIEQYKIYEETLNEKNYVDFSEILLRLHERLKKDEAYRESLQQRFKAYLVDEFQDTNPIQYEILLLLTEKFKGEVSQKELKKYYDKNGEVVASIFAVGDDSQSIYSFRGANVKNIFDFKNKAQYVKLEQNYRSSKRIVELSNLFIQHAEERIDKNLFTENKEGDKIAIYQAFNEYDEANHVAKQIETLAKQKSTSFKNFAVLYRGNAQSARLEMALSLLKIPFKVSGGMSFFEKAEIKTVLACARLLNNPNDHNSFIRVVEKLKLAKINKKIMEGWHKESELEKLNFSNLIMERKALKYKELDKLYKLIWKAQEDFKFFSLREVFEDFLDKIGLFKVMKEEKQSQKLENIELFLQQIEKYEEGGNSFSHFMYLLEQMNFFQEGDKVNLMTIHSSKGLEFDYVFFVGVEDGIIPSQHAIEDENTEEERRLMYVALTRAKKALFITFCEKRFNGFEHVEYPPSRFLNDLQGNYLHFLNETKLNVQEFDEQIEDYREEYDYDDNEGSEEKQEELSHLQGIYKTKDGLGELIEVKFNEYGEKIFVIETDEIKEYLEGYDLIEKMN